MPAAYSVVPESTLADDVLPRWDMSGVFPGLASAPFEQAVADLTRQIDALKSVFDAPALSATDAERVIGQLDRALARAEIVETYASCVAFTDADDQAAQRALDLVTRLRGRLNA